MGQQANNKKSLAQKESRGLTPITSRIPKSLKRELKLEAARRDEDMSDLLAEAIAEYLKVEAHD